MIVIPKGYVGIRERMGMTCKVLKSGPHLYIPIIDKVHILDTRSAIVRSSIMSMSSDGIPCRVRISVVLSLDDPYKIFTSGRDLNFIETKVSQSLRLVMFNNTMESILSAKSISNDIDSYLSSSLYAYGYSVYSVHIEETWTTPRSKAHPQIQNEVVVDEEHMINISYGDEMVTDLRRSLLGG
jgi:hypothetical protein